MTNWDIAYLVLAIIWVSLTVIGVIIISNEIHLREKELRHIIKLRIELEKKIKEFNEKEKNNELYENY